MEKEYCFDKSPSKKTYRVITDYLQKEIENGKYKCGEKLPSEKEIGEKFNASRSSVREALSALEYVGLIEVRGGSGYYVSGNVMASQEEILSHCAAKLVFTLDDKWNLKTVKALFAQGIDGANIILSKKDQTDSYKQIRMIRQAAHDTHSTIAIMAHIFADQDEEVSRLTETAVRAKIDAVVIDCDRDPQQILVARRTLDMLDDNMLVFARISMISKDLEDILRVTDGMVITDSLLLTDKNAAAVNEIVNKCNSYGKIAFADFTIRDTVVMGSNCKDAIAKAVIAGFDGVMATTDESAQKFPLNVIGMLNSVVGEAENRLEMKSEKRIGRIVSSPVVNALCVAAVNAAVAMRAKAFIVPSETGFTPRLLAKFRNRIPLIAISPNAGVIRQLKLVWGVQPLLSRRTLRQEDIIQLSVDTALKANYLSEGDSVVGVIGNMDIPNVYNAVKLIVVGDIILKGQGIGDGIISGRVTIIKTLFDINKNVKNKIVVAKATEAEHVKIIEDAAALIVEEGGLSSHAAITCLTLGKPVIVGAEDALDLLVEGEQVTVDIMRGLVYRGWVNLG